MPLPPDELAAAARARVGVAAAAAQLRAAGMAVDAEVEQSAQALCQRGAVALPRAHERALALTLAAVAWAAEARPVHLVAAGDDEALALAALVAPWLRCCGLPEGAVEPTTLRRLAAARTQAERSLRRPELAAVALPPAHAALIDDLDRVLVDEAAASITLAVADDATGLIDALTRVSALALELRPDDPGVDDIHEHEHAALDAIAPSLPPVWRSRERRERLLRQAWFVRRLQRGPDYELAPQGQVLFDDSLMTRLPDRGFASGLTQALQLHLGLAPAPVARTVGRLHSDLLLAPYTRLAGVAPSLQGLRHELWARHRLQVTDTAAGPPPLPLRWCASREAADDAIEAWLAAALAEPGSRLLVLRRPQALVRWGPRVAALRALGAAVSVAVDGVHSPLPPGLALRELPAGAPLALLFAEPLESVRAERAWYARAADHAGSVRAAEQLLTPPVALAREHLPTLAALQALLDRLLPAAALLRRPLHTQLLRLARLMAARRGGRLRRQQGERESRLGQQLSFTTGQRSAAPAPPWRPGAAAAADAPSSAP
jgi:hypothetical protein